MNKYPVSGEINLKVSDPQAVLKKVEANYRGRELSIDHTDGTSVEFENWRFNLRPSNTEPVIRLNVEARQDKELLRTKTDEIINMIKD